MTSTDLTEPVQQLAERVRAAAAAGTPLQIQGGGSKRFLGQAPQGELLSTLGLAGVRSYEPSELVVTVGAGTPLAALEALLAQHGQCLPFEPPHFAAGGSATCGGMVAAGLSGPARACVGSVRDYVLGASLINGRGERLTFGGQVMKNVAGYDVSRLMAGAWGTLGVLTEISLKVLPQPPATATLRFAWDEARSLQQLHAWGGQPLPLSASCWHDTPADGPVLMLRLSGAVAAVQAACQSLGGEAVAPEQALAFWQDCREQRLPFFAAPPQPGLSLWRLSLPQTAPALSLPASAWPAPQARLIEWQGAQRWLWAPASAAVQIRAAAQALGGHATLWRPANEAERAVGVFHPLVAPQDRIQRELKRQFDPAGVLNPARLYPEF